MIISLANLIVDHDPMTVARRTQDTMRYAQAEWTKSHEEPIDVAELHKFLCDEHYGDLTEEQKCFVRKCKEHVDRMYLRMLYKKEHESEAMCRPALPARSRCVRFFRRGKECTPAFKIWPLWAALGGFRGTKGQAG